MTPWQVEAWELPRKMTHRQVVLLAGLLGILSLAWLALTIATAALAFILR